VGAGALHRGKVIVRANSVDRVWRRMDGARGGGWRLRPPIALDPTGHPQDEDRLTGMIAPVANVSARATSR